MFELFPYQLEGAKYLVEHDHALLADEMGLGKSAQAIRACDMVGAVNILVLCPAAVRINWVREFDRFSEVPRTARILAKYEDRPKAGQLNVVSYDLIGANEKVRQHLRSIPWDVLIMDEAHYCKERSAKRTRAVYGHSGKQGIIHAAQRCWRLTGTPAPNDASELWTHLKSAGIEKRGYWDFVYDFCSGFESSFGFRINGHKNVDKLKKLLGQFMLRRKKDEVMKQLPKLTFQEVPVEKSEVQLDPYFFENWRTIGVKPFLADLARADDAARKAIQLLNDANRCYTQNSDQIALLNSLASSTATLRRYIGLAKLPRCLDILEEELTLDPKLKLVLFAIHKDVIECTRLRLDKFHPVTLYGGTPAVKRQRHIDRFQNDPSCRVFIGNIVAAGTGITLTASNEVCFLETDWTPANNAQAAMRCHRVGQTRPVRVRFFSCVGSVDEDVTKTLIHKTRELSKIFD